jgi:hypothetical protein
MKTLPELQAIASQLESASDKLRLRVEENQREIETFVAGGLIKALRGTRWLWNGDLYLNAATEDLESEICKVAGGCSNQDFFLCGQPVQLRITHENVTLRLNDKAVVRDHRPETWPQHASTAVQALREHLIIEPSPDLLTRLTRATNELAKHQSQYDKVLEVLAHDPVQAVHG